MPDWQELLRPENLQVPEPGWIAAIHAEAKEDLDGDPYVRVWVVMRSDAPEMAFSHDARQPIQTAIFDAVLAEPAAGYAVVGFTTAEGWANKRAAAEQLGVGGG